MCVCGECGCACACLKHHPNLHCRSVRGLPAYADVVRILSSLEKTDAFVYGAMHASLKALPEREGADAVTLVDARILKRAAEHLQRVSRKPVAVHEEKSMKRAAVGEWANGKGGGKSQETLHVASYSVPLHCGFLTPSHLTTSPPCPSPPLLLLSPPLVHLPPPLHRRIHGVPARDTPGV